MGLFIPPLPSQPQWRRGRVRGSEKYVPGIDSHPAQLFCFKFLFLNLSSKRTAVLHSFTFFGPKCLKSVALRANRRMKPNGAFYFHEDNDDRLVQQREVGEENQCQIRNLQPKLPLRSIFSSFTITFNAQMKKTFFSLLYIK